MVYSTVELIGASFCYNFWKKTSQQKKFAGNAQDLYCFRNLTIEQTSIMFLAAFVRKLM